jgi:hypothetical protein
MYLGDFVEDAAVTCRFDTTDQTGALITLAGSPAARCRRGSGSGTTITAGITLTADVVTGQHVIDVDTSADAAYTPANDYSIELTAGTVSGISQVGKIVARFSIENRNIKANVTQFNGSNATASSGRPEVNVTHLDGTSGAGNAAADALLARNVSGSSSTGRTVKQALHFLRNKWTVSAGTLTVYDTDDSTSSWTATVSSDAGAEPIVGNDPS